MKRKVVDLVDGLLPPFSPDSPPTGRPCVPPLGSSPPYDMGGGRRNAPTRGGPGFEPERDFSGS